MFMSAKNRRQLTQAMGIAMLGALTCLTVPACSSGGGSKGNVTRGTATPSRFVPSRTTSPAEAARRSEWRYQGKTKYHNVY